jgi:hypothetical protein
VLFLTEDALRGAAFEAVRDDVARDEVVRGAGAAFFAAFAATARRGLPFDAARRAFPGADVRVSRAIFKFSYREI